MATENMEMNGDAERNNGAEVSEGNVTTLNVIGTKCPASHLCHTGTFLLPCPPHHYLLHVLCLHHVFKKQCCLFINIIIWDLGSTASSRLWEKKKIRN